MALDGFVTRWEILGGIGVGKARPGGVVAVFDGGEPGGHDGKPGSGEEVADEGSDAGQVVGVEGGVDAAGGVTDVGCGGVRVDVADGGGWGDVYVTGARVGDGYVGDGDARRGGATAKRGRDTARNRS